MHKRKFHSGGKYLAVALVNGLLLTGLLALWTDPLEITFHDLVRPIEFLKIIGVSFLALMAMFLLCFFWRRRSIPIRVKVLVASLLAVIISSGLYVGYSRLVFHNVIVEGRVRAQIAEKIRPSDRLADGTKADRLSFEEYHEVASVAGFPGIPPEATNIKYDYQYDGFLSDYSLDITYEVPKATRISPSEDRGRRYTRSQTVEGAGDHKRVCYHEDIH